MKARELKFDFQSTFSYYTRVRRAFEVVFFTIGENKCIYCYVQGSGDDKMSRCSFNHKYLSFCLFSSCDYGVRCLNPTLNHLSEKIKLSAGF